MRQAFFPDTITLYNKYKDATGKDLWKRTILDRCYWVKETIKTATTSNTASIASNVSVRIIQRAAYKPPDVWLADRVGFTLQTGDLVLLGSHAVEITGAGDYTMAKIKATYGGVEIKTVSVWDKPFMRNQHYRILGV